MTNLLIPCAGQSTRFPGKPKWLLTCPNGNLMIQECIDGLDLLNIKTIYIGFLKEHVDNYCNDLDIKNLFKFTNKKIEIIILNEKTKSQSETVYKMIKNKDIKGSIFIKDCDNYFTHEIIPNENYLCFVEINENTNITKTYNKSFVDYDNSMICKQICEKQIISPFICVGGYAFSDTQNFLKLYEKNENYSKELYISYLIKDSINNYNNFYCKKVNNYIDWGTIEEWESYRNKFKTLFIDLDGVLVINSSENISPKWGTTEAIKENVEYLNNIYSTKKVKIIITTSRKSSFKEITIQQLKKYNIPYDDIIFDLFHCKRYLINDFSNTNKYPTSVSINLKRNDNNLKDLL